MSKVIDLTGQRFGRLTVIERKGSTKDGKATWLCQCDCGKQTVVIGKNLRSSSTKGCGCLNTAIDLTGQRFGRLVVLSRAENRNKRTMWNCICDCGNKVVVGGHDMKNGSTKSCGCYHKERIPTPPRMSGKENPSYKHGQTGSKLFWVWSGILQRCTNKNNKGFHLYGGRGIKVYEEWLDSFEAFSKWAMANGYSEGLSIDRIDSDGDYCPENCRWVDRITQSNNRRCNIIITKNGETHTLGEWAKITQIPYKTLLARYYRQGDTEKLFMELKK